MQKWEKVLLFELMSIIAMLWIGFLAVALSSGNPLAASLAGIVTGVGAHMNNQILEGILGYSIVHSDSGC